MRNFLNRILNGSPTAVTAQPGNAESAPTSPTPDQVAVKRVQELNITPDGRGVLRSETPFTPEQASKFMQEIPAELRREWQLNAQLPTSGDVPPGQVYIVVNAEGFITSATKISAGQGSTSTPSLPSR